MKRQTLPFCRTTLAVTVSNTLRALGLAALPLLSVPAMPAVAQNLFAPVAQVNDSVVTRYEMDQRRKLIAVLGGTASEAEALDALIEDKIKLEAARRANITPTDEAVASAISDFAARGSLAPEQLITLLGRNDVSSQTLRDFITVGLVWRDYASARFASRVSVTDADIDRALREASPTGGLLVQMSEIFLPARTPEERAASERLAASIAANPSIAAFAAAARKYSVAPSRANSGRMQTTPIGNLPGPLRTAARTLQPGGISETLSTQNAIGIFQLRKLSETETPTPAATRIEYAAYYIAGGHSDEAQSKANKVRAQVDSCSDLYGIAKGQPAEVLEIDTLDVSDIPTDVATQLAQLDPGEVSTALTRANGQTLVFLMLCERHYGEDETVDRDAVLSRLRVERIGNMAENHLAELLADAAIIRK